MIVNLGVNPLVSGMCTLLKRNTLSFLYFFLIYMRHARGECGVRGRPRLKSTEMNEKIEMESLSKSLPHT